jgi:spermidine/putrescine transport system substrate-binding protein
LAGRVTMLDDPGEVLGACLKKLGYSLNATEPRQLERAKAEAVAQKNILRAYLNAEVRDQLVAGDVLAAQLWATTAQQAAEVSGEVRFVYPREGFALYADNAAILRESRRIELAHRFLDYLLRPEVARAIVRTTRTAAANGEAREENAVLYPSPEVLSRGEWFEPLPAAAQRLRDRLWTEIKSA